MSIITLPSGAKIEFRAMTLHEQDTLLSSKSTSWLETLIAVMSKCTVNVIDAGIYPNAESFNWLDAYEGDLFYGLLHFRKVSYDNTYDFKTQCEVCGRSLDVEMDIDEMDVIEPTDDVHAVISRGESSIKMPLNDGDSNLTLEIRIPTGRQLIKMMKSRSLKKGKVKARKRGGSSMETEGRKVRNTLEDRIKGIEGMKPQEFKEWLDNANSRVLPKLLDLTESVAFGVDSDIEFECHFCDGLTLATAPMSKDFFLPWQRKARKKPNIF